MGYSTRQIEVKKAVALVRKNKMQVTSWSQGRNASMIHSAPMAEITDHEKPKIIFSWQSYPPDFIQFEARL